MKLTDFVAEHLAKNKIDTVFGVTGGAIVHFFDSAVKQGLKCVYTHHEQTAAFAAHAYAKIKGLGACFVTTGPGGTNTTTGVAAAWLDSTPIIIIAGQVRQNQIKPSTIRQQGTQELDVPSILSPLLKYSVTLKDPNMILYELEKCLYIAQSGRPGPVLLEVPLDLHWVEIENLNSLPSYPKIDLKTQASDEEINLITKKLSEAQSPLFLLGGGIRLANAQQDVKRLLDRTKIPYVTTWTAKDLVDGSDPLNLGSPGMFGARGANLAIQASDFLCCLGTNLPIPVTTTMINQFATKAQIAVVNIDAEELKHQRVHVEYPIHAEVKNFIQRLSKSASTHFNELWHNKAQKLSEYYNQYDIAPLSEEIDAYRCLKVISDHLNSYDSIVVDGGGTIVQIAFQTFSPKGHQRMIIDSGLCAMGSGFPNAIGCAFAQKQGNTICLCGDGSFQFNVQELETIFHHQLPVKIFIFNNSGYLSIRNTQEQFLKNNFQGSSKEGGLSIPDIQAIAKAYRIPTHLIRQTNELESSIKKVLNTAGPSLLEVQVSTQQQIQPRIGFIQKEDKSFAAQPIENMYPFLPKKEIEELLAPSCPSITNK